MGYIDEPTSTKLDSVVTRTSPSKLYLDYQRIVKQLLLEKWYHAEKISLQDRPVTVADCPNCHCIFGVWP